MKTHPSPCQKTSVQRPSFPQTFSWFARGLVGLLKGFVYFYRGVLSPFLRPRCRFLPTCSEYALDALTCYGPYRGSLYATKRIGRCHPWGGHGFDPVKEEKDE